MTLRLVIALFLGAMAVLIAKYWATPREKPLSGGRGPSTNQKKAHPQKMRHIVTETTQFQEYAENYEKRYLAYLIAAEAERRGADMETIDRLRMRYGKELFPPPYGAQRWLHSKGVSLGDILDMQEAWISRNGGNPDVLPASLEVERIIKARNLEKAREICRKAGIG